MKFFSFFRSSRMDLFLAIYIFGVLIVNLMGAKVMPLGRFAGMDFNISVAIFLMPIMFTITDAISEVYGRKKATSMVRASLVVVVMMVLFSMLATALPAAERFTANEAYGTVFGMSVRMGVASVVAFAVSSLFDVRVYNYLVKKIGRGKKIWLRNNLSNWLGQFVDSVVFVTLAFYSFERGFGDNVGWLLGMILPYFLAKCLVSVLCTPLVYVAIRFLKKEKLAGATAEVEDRLTSDS